MCNKILTLFFDEKKTKNLILDAMILMGIFSGNFQSYFYNFSDIFNNLFENLLKEIVRIKKLMDEPTDPVIPSETDLCRLAELVEMFDPGEDVEFPDKVSVVSEHKICPDRLSRKQI